MIDFSNKNDCKCNSSKPYNVLDFCSRKNMIKNTSLLEAQKVETMRNTALGDAWKVFFGGEYQIFTVLKLFQSTVYRFKYREAI